MVQEMFLALFTLIFPVISAARSAEDYHVGTRWPTVPFEVPESWAGLMPITEVSGNTSSKNDLFFWYFKQDEGCGSSDDLVIWLNGGPGCSSLAGLLQENGPVLFPKNLGGRPDQPYVKLNPYSWNKLASVVWVDQPVGTGFSTGTMDTLSYRGYAAELFSFLQNFYDTFPENKGKNLWITGESQAGMYVPYTADYIYDHEAESKASGINLKGISINDPVFTNFFLSRDAAVVPFVQNWHEELGLNDTFLDKFYQDAKSLGLFNYMEKNLVYPARSGGFYEPNTTQNGPSLYESVFEEAYSSNKYFYTYNIKESVQSEDPLGGIDELSDNILNNIPGFKQLIHAPNKNWSECIDFFSLATEVPSNAYSSANLFPDVSILPGVIEKSERTLIQHGLNDFQLLANGSALAIQNMTWGGSRGFYSRPKAALRVGGEDAGTYHSERGLTFITVTDSGHMIPEDKPAVAFKNLQYLLGQISYEDLGRDNAGCSANVSSSSTTSGSTKTRTSRQTNITTTSSVSGSTKALSTAYTTVNESTAYGPSAVLRGSTTTTGPSILSGNVSLPKDTVTADVTSYVTYCPQPTTFKFGNTSITVTAPTTLTLTDCLPTATLKAHQTLSSSKAGGDKSSGITPSSGTLEPSPRQTTNLPPQANGAQCLKGYIWVLALVFI